MCRMLGISRKTCLLKVEMDRMCRMLGILRKNSFFKLTWTECAECWLILVFDYHFSAECAECWVFQGKHSVQLHWGRDIKSFEKDFLQPLGFVLGTL